MKTMTCRQLGGACDLEFQGNTFKEIAVQSRAHGKAMFEAGDAEHLNAMKEMQVLMQTPGAMQEWFEAKNAKFDAL